jgi:hypothetical protein
LWEQNIYRDESNPSVLLDIVECCYPDDKGRDKVLATLAEEFEELRGPQAKQSRRIVKEGMCLEHVS